MNAEPITLIRFPSHAARAVSFLAHGQKCETWLRPGVYRSGGECWLDIANNVRALTVFGVETHNKGTFYVRPDVLTAVPGVELA